MAEDGSDTSRLEMQGDEEGQPADQWVKISQTQLAQLIQSLDETRAVLLDLAGGHGDPGTRRRKSWWGRHCWPSRRRFLYRNITLITVILQFLNLMMLSVIDVLPRHLVQEYNMIVASSATMITLQVLNLFILILASGRLAKQVIHHDVNSFFLAQSYLATLLLFAGLYTLTYRLDGKSWKFLNENLTSNPIQVFKLYIKFLFYSISTATLCGSDNALPIDWYNHLFAGTQMLLSFCYFASILGIALSPGQSTKPKYRESPSRSGGFHRSVSSTLETVETQSNVRFLLSDSSSTSESPTTIGDTQRGFLTKEHLHLKEQQEEHHVLDQDKDKHPNLNTSNQSHAIEIAPNDILVHLGQEHSQEQQITNNNRSYHNDHKHGHVNGKQKQKQQHQQPQGQQLRYPASTGTQLHRTTEDSHHLKGSCNIQHVDERFGNSRTNGIDKSDDEPLLRDGC